MYIQWQVSTIKCDHFTMNDDTLASYSFHLPVWCPRTPRVGVFLNKMEVRCSCVRAVSLLKTGLKTITIQCDTSDKAFVTSHVHSTFPNQYLWPFRECLSQFSRENYMYTFRRATLTLHGWSVKADSIFWIVFWGVCCIILYFLFPPLHWISSRGVSA